MSVLVLLRHGESARNAANVFTGWIDVGLSGHGAEQAQQAGALIAASGYLPEVVHTLCSASGHPHRGPGACRLRAVMDSRATFLATQLQPLRRAAGAQ